MMAEFPYLSQENFPFETPRIVILQDFLTTGTVKSFQLKGPTGKLLCEYDDGFYD